MNANGMNDWRQQQEIMRLTSPWVTLVAERWVDQFDCEIDYWRVERPDSAIVVPVQAGELLLVTETFRPGVGRSTLDFPGGRIPVGKRPQDSIGLILERELGVGAEFVSDMRPINSEGWIVDSSFSSQKLWGFEVEIDRRWCAPERCALTRVPVTNASIDMLVEQLTCLQCRALLLEWIKRRVF
ncbi:MAG: hypothetical protein PHP86_19610 [Nevskiales bacterium]|nr:hypothetical protein [Nevskiales bacterium]